MFRVLKSVFKEFRSGSGGFVAGIAVLASLLLSFSAEAIEMQDHPELLTLAEELVGEGFERSVYNVCLVLWSSSRALLMR